MKRDYVVHLKIRGLTEKQQIRVAMEGRAIAKRIKPEGRVVIGIEQKGGKK